MANEEALHGCVTKFMLDTCRYSTNEYKTDVAFFHFLTRMLANNMPEGAEMFLSGSSAEICIKPMFSCIGDIDIMQATWRVLVIPSGYEPPTELPSNYRNTVLVYDITDSHQPGYVYLQPSYILRKTHERRYAAEKVENKHRKNDAVFLCRSGNVNVQQITEAFFQKFFNHHEIRQTAAIQSLLTGISLGPHGPALTGRYSITANEHFNKVTHRYLSLSGVDIVTCIHCFVWPPQAIDWPTRKRDHGWPDATTINTVVSNGCDVVGAVHPLCKQDQWLSKYQCRLSFSRAEVTLLNTWTPVQQIIYHMLRFIMKCEVLAKTDENNPDMPTLSNYHIKTLMLWECEQKPQSWWSAESSFIKLCSSLLHKLSDCVADKLSQHYFISNCNLLEHFDEHASLAIGNSIEWLADESVLLLWFVENYIPKCAECCPPEVTILFQDICSYDAVVAWRQKSLSTELYTEHHKSELRMLAVVLLDRMDATGILMHMKELQNFDLRLCEYFIAVTCLRVAYTISIHSVSDNPLEILWTLFNPCKTTAVGGMDTSEWEMSRQLVFIRRAISLLRLHSIGSNALEMLYNEMSKAFLHYGIACVQESTICVVHVLLAALCYKTGNYQAATDWCQEVLNKNFIQSHSLRSIGADCLPHIDENVDSVFGLVVFYEYVQRQALKPGVYRQEQSKLAFTVELLAHYLYLECPTVARWRASKLSKYQQHLSKTNQPLLCDVLLFKKMKMRLNSDCGEMPAGNDMTIDASHASNSTDNSLLVISLELVSLEKLISFRQVVVHELHSEQFPVLNEFEALYAYKCGLFEDCLEMCRNHVNMLLRAGCARNQLYPIALPQFVSMLDGELVSLSGLIRLLHPGLFLLGLMFQYPNYESMSVLTLSLYLMVQCQKKLREDACKENRRS